MTREEAIELRLKNIGARTKAIMPEDMLREITAAEIDFYIASGMLKLQEPKWAAMKLNDILFVQAGYAPQEITRLFDFIDRAGLKIVEK